METASVHCIPVCGTVFSLSAIATYCSIYLARRGGRVALALSIWRGEDVVLHWLYICRGEEVVLLGALSGWRGEANL